MFQNIFAEALRQAEGEKAAAKTILNWLEMVGRIDPDGSPRGSHDNSGKIPQNISQICGELSVGLQTGWIFWAADWSQASTASPNEKSRIGISGIQTQIPVNTDTGISTVFPAVCLVWNAEVDPASFPDDPNDPRFGTYVQALNSLWAVYAYQIRDRDTYTAFHNEIIYAISASGLGWSRMPSEHGGWRADSDGWRVPDSVS